MAWFLATTVWIYNSISVGLAQASSYSFDDGKLITYVESKKTQRGNTGDLLFVIVTDKCGKWQISINVALAICRHGM